MRALVPSGGAGTRLRPITHTSAKQLVPVANRPILFYVLDDIAAAGITEVALVVGETAAEIEAAVGEGSAWGLRVSYVRQDEPLGLAHTVQVARDVLGDEPFLMYLGDNMLREGVSGFVRAFEAEPCAAQILVTPVADPTRYGVVELDGDRVVRLVEKPTDPPSDLALVGVYLFDRRIHDAVEGLAPSWRGELEITEAIQRLVDAGEPVRVRRVDGWWKDTGHREDLLEANRLVLETIATRIDGTVDQASKLTGAVIVGQGAEVVNATIRGPAIIGEGARVVDSFIGPFTAVGPRCVIEDAEIEHSVVMEGCVIRGVHRLEDSLLGREVTIEQVQRRPKAYRFMVGDHGQVEVV